MRAWLGSIPTIALATKHWWWEFVRSFFYEKIMHLIGEVAWPDWLLSWGLSALLVLAAGWLWWPTLKDRIPALGTKYVPLDDAARLAYEGLERAGVLDVVLSRAVGPQTSLDHLKYVFLTSDNIDLRGIRPPSRQSLPIQPEEIRKLFPTDKHPDSLSYIVGREPIYTGVSIRKRDLQRAVRQQVKAAKASVRGNP